MAINVARYPNPGLVDALRHELFKGSKQRFYQIVLLAPLGVTALIIVVQLLVKLFGRPTPGVPITFSGPYGLGSEGTFAFASNIYSSLFSSYTIVVIIACALAVANEYRWNTIKMLATRQASRTFIVLSKCLFAFSLIAGVFLSTVVGWFIYALFLKFFFDAPFGFTAADITNIGSGLKHFALSSLVIFIYGLAAIMLTYRFKSVVAGIIGYVIYNGVDSLVSAFGTRLILHPELQFEDWLKPLAEVVKFLNPFMLSSSANRVMMVETMEQSRFASGTFATATNEQIVASNPVWWAYIMLLIYVALFTYLSIQVFKQRDITD